MLDFLTACTGLFSDTFAAACELEFFRFLASIMILQVGLGIFLLLSRGTRKL